MIVVLVIMLYMLAFGWFLGILTAERRAKVLKVSAGGLAFRAVIGLTVAVLSAVALTQAYLT